ncbi:MAG: helix-turn-helix transcriptional regulator [Treponema sp.]|jgi:transcriptional regulator with XRE-family HTH domain|nr:helix-turn-helix transcriptional regulator [Treponema sp.]
MTLKQIFIRNLKEFRKKEGLSQHRLADSCGTAATYIAQIETGRKFPSMEMIEKMANMLRIEPYHFFKEPNNNNISNIGVENLFPLLPVSMKNQINDQINQSTSEFLKEINKIINKY